MFLMLIWARKSWKFWRVCCFTTSSYCSTLEGSYGSNIHSCFLSLFYAIISILFFKLVLLRTLLRSSSCIMTLTSTKLVSLLFTVL